jgi:hypothetical protein
LMKNIDLLTQKYVFQKTTLTFKTQTLIIHY